MNMQKPTVENQRGLKAPVFKTFLPVGPFSFLKWPEYIFLYSPYPDAYFLLFKPTKKPSNKPRP
jgi:hypothetical protein